MNQPREYCEALIDYCEHQPPCIFSSNTDGLPDSKRDRCSCGLDSLIEQVRITFARGGRPVNVETQGNCMFGTAHWYGTIGGFPALVVSYHGGSALWVFKNIWEKMNTFSGLAEAYEFLGLTESPSKDSEL